MTQIFISHSKYDEKFCNSFDSACRHVGLKGFRSEFESIPKPEWKSINKEINKSNAFFLLVGKELVERHELYLKDHSTFSDWVFTQNWISYEVGVASQRRLIDVWVLCDGVNINFPVPYLNNYHVAGFDLRNPDSRNFIYSVLEAYSHNSLFNLEEGLRYTCPNCCSTYNLWTSLVKGSQILCPTCLTTLSFSDGWCLKNQSLYSLPIAEIIRRVVSKR